VTRLACDVGGTFTDLVAETSDGTLRLHKTATTPADPVDGVLAAIDLAAAAAGRDRRAFLAGVGSFVHGTTRAINAILTGTTARTAFLATAGHRDILLLREGGRLEPYDNSQPFPQPYVPRALTFEVPERIGADGRIVQPLDEAAVRRLAALLGQARVEAIGVCLLWSIANPAHELAVERILQRELPDIPLTLSHRLNPSIREYRRASSTCIDASLKPLMGRYLRDLGERLRAEGFGGRLLMVTSQGGMMDAADMAAAPIHAVNSGPAMAPVAGRRFAREPRAEADMVIVADAGGTSFDVSLVRGDRIPWTRETWLGPPFRGHLTGFPSVDVKSIGAGGGSIARVDADGLLQVGPQSAGADPGPACYGRGGRDPTVTDCALTLGLLDPDYFLGGAMRLDAEAARAAVDRAIGRPLGLSTAAAAAAALAVATENMAAAIEEITVKQGIDPRGALLVGGGGAAGFNIVAIARRLGCARVLIPAAGAALSAAGGLLSDLATDRARMLFMRSDAFDRAAVNAALDELAKEAAAFVSAAGAAAHMIDFLVEARYPQQTWEIELPLRVRRFAGAADVERLAEDFHALHRRLYAVDDPSSPVELVTWRVRVRCRLRPDGEARIALTAAAAEAASREIHADGLGRRRIPVLRLGGLPVGEPVHGPAIVESELTTVLVEPGSTATRLASGSLLIALEEAVAAPRVRAEAADLAVLSKRLESIARKMAHTLHRTGRSGLINTARDLSCCIVSADHELVAEAESLPSHVLVGPDLMSRAMQEFHPQLRRGDAFLHNSPYHGNSHAADHTIMVPVIDDGGTHRFTVFAKAHQADIGNSMPTTYTGNAVDVYNEGALIFPAVKVQEDYRHIDDIVRMCRLRIRVPEQWWGDYLALLGAARIGERELLALGAEVGWDALHEHVRRWMDYAERRMAAALARLPSGRRTRVSIHDPFPGTPADGVPIKVTVAVDAEAGRIEVDLRDNPDCLPNGLNLSQANAASAAMIGIFSSLGEVVPRNAGSYRRIEIRLRENCCVGIPRHPASCSLSTTNLASKVGNATQAAIADLADGFGLAESGVIVPASMAVISGRDPRHGHRPFMNSLFLMHTGGPGAPKADAWLTTVHIGDLGLCYLDSVEVDELRYPIRVVRRGILPDTEGAGRYCGAPAGFCEYGPVDTRLEAWFSSDGTLNAPLGVRGGLPGGRASQFKRGRNGQLTEVPPCGGVVLEPGETLVSTCCGGGGYGPPAARDPTLVRRDLAEGWITPARAALYGLADAPSLTPPQP
jgi:N-methylhydantoinase A